MPKTTTTLRACPMGWSDFDGNCYKLLSTVGTWYNAAEHFQDVGADLTSVHSRREEDFLNYVSG